MFLNFDFLFCIWRGLSSYTPVYGPSMRKMMLGLTLWPLAHNLSLFIILRMHIHSVGSSETHRDYWTKNPLWCVLAVLFGVLLFMADKQYLISAVWYLVVARICSLGIEHWSTSLVSLCRCNIPVTLYAVSYSKNWINLFFLSLVSICLRISFPRRSSAVGFFGASFLHSPQPGYPKNVGFLYLLSPWLLH